MTISAIGGGFAPPGLQDRLLGDLKKAGLSDTLANQAQGELRSAFQSAGASGGFEPGKIQEALGNQLETDVQSGKLTQDQSDQISQAFATLQQQFQPGGPGGAGGFQGPPPGLAGGNGGGAGGADSAAGTTLDAILQQLESARSGKGGKTDSDTAAYLSKLFSNGLLKVDA